MTKPYITIKHIIVEIVGYVLTLMAFIVAIVGAITIEGPIVTNYGSSGEPTGYGSVASLFLPPAMNLATLVLLSLLSHFGKDSYYHFRHPVRPEKKMIALSDSAMMVFVISLIISLYGLVMTIMLAVQNGTGVFVATIAMSVLVLVAIIIMSIKLEKDIK